MSIPQHRLTLCPVPRASRAFSILEGLIVVALLGVLSTIAIQWYANAQHEILERTVNQRNAQEIVSLGVCATVSGADFVVPDNKQATVQNLISGTVGRHGQWKGKTFRLSSLRPDFLPGALTFVKFDSGLLLYDPAGGQL
ncbi:MAG: hypothetical protein U1F71_04745 [Verrucomicrobiaceae bacterium]